FKWYKKVNGGVASSRNYGVNMATGDFIIHHDADDFMPEKAIELLIKKAEETKADIIIGNYNVICGASINEISQMFNGSWNQLVEGLVNGNFHGGLWNKLIRRRLYENLSFVNDINYMEDKLMLIKILVTYKPTIYYINEIVYNYIQY